MTEKAVTSVAVPDVEGMAQNFAFVRRVGKLKGMQSDSKVVSGYLDRGDDFYPRCFAVSEY